MAFPRNAKLRNAVGADDHAAVIDLCNRFCLATDTWDVEIRADGGDALTGDSARC